jgi:hypothetical protein
MPGCSCGFCLDCLVKTLNICPPFSIKDYFEYNTKILFEKEKNRTYFAHLKALSHSSRETFHPGLTTDIVVYTSTLSRITTHILYCIVPGSVVKGGLPVALLDRKSIAIYAPRHSGPLQANKGTTNIL